jgi:hypothetical protein
LDRYLTEDLGLDLSEEGGPNKSAESEPERVDLRIEARLPDSMR